MTEIYILNSLLTKVAVFLSANLDKSVNGAMNTSTARGWREEVKLKPAELEDGESL